MADFEAARDRVLMGQRRESTVLSDKEKEATAYHEGGHAVLAYVLPDADPVHKVTILPTGMALGVTQQLPIEERHTYWREYIEDAVCVMMGGRCAENLILGSLSTGASNDLQRATEMARKMVREFGMSERIGPMAWGQEGQVFLGEDLMHAARDYSDVTSRVIDEEVERILREQEATGQPAAQRASPRAGRGGRRPARARRPSTGPRSGGWSTRPTAGRSTSTSRWCPASPRTRPTVRARDCGRHPPGLYPAGPGVAPASGGLILEPAAAGSVRDAERHSEAQADARRAPGSVRVRFGVHRVPRR